MTGLIGFNAAYRQGLGMPLAIVTDIFFICNAALLWQTTSCARTKMESRQQLRRLNLCLRLACLMTSINFLVQLTLPLSRGGRLIILGTGDHKFALLICCISYALVAFTFSQSARGKLQQWLGAHFLTRSGSKLQEASFVAGLICGIPADQVYLTAKSLFQGEPLRLIEHNHERMEPVQAQPPYLLMRTMPFQEFPWIALKTTCYSIIQIQMGSRGTTRSPSSKACLSRQRDLRSLERWMHL
jgi:hypothetical protein